VLRATANAAQMAAPVRNILDFWIFQLTRLKKASGFKLPIFLKFFKSTIASEVYRMIYQPVAEERHYGWLVSFQTSDLVTLPPS
jgi:uncharacterized protein YecE (DUF72 family)